MGCGKSSVGKDLSTLLGIPVIDLDRYIEEKAGKSIPDIFAEHGEAYFRDLETSALTEVLSKQSFILSLGGGTILREENVEMIKERCTCVYLRAGVETLRRHLGGEQSQRPLLKGGGFEALLEERRPLYAAAADFTIDIDTLTPMQIAGIIANLIS